MPLAIRIPESLPVAIVFSRAPRPVQLVVDLASGRADAPIGCYLAVFDDLGVLLLRAAEIERRKALFPTRPDLTAT
jgi:hypothetical protein